MTIDEIRKINSVREDLWQSWNNGTYYAGEPTKEVRQLMANESEHKIRGLRASHCIVDDPLAEPTEEELAEIRKAEGEPDPLAAISVNGVSYTLDQWEAEARLNSSDIINRAFSTLAGSVNYAASSYLDAIGVPQEWRRSPLSDEEKARRKAKNKRRAATRFRARERRRAEDVVFWGPGHELVFRTAAPAAAWRLLTEAMPGIFHGEILGDEELRRQAGASALAPTVLPALAAGPAPVSPEPEADLLTAIREAARKS